GDRQIRADPVALHVAGVDRRLRALERLRAVVEPVLVDHAQREDVVRLHAQVAEQLRARDLDAGVRISGARPAEVRQARRPDGELPAAAQRLAGVQPRRRVRDQRRPVVVVRTARRQQRDDHDHDEGPHTATVPRVAAPEPPALAPAALFRPSPPAAYGGSHSFSTGAYVPGGGTSNSSTCSLAVICFFSDGVASTFSICSRSSAARSSGSAGLSTTPSFGTSSVNASTLSRFALPPHSGSSPCRPANSAVRSVSNDSSASRHAAYEPSIDCCRNARSTATPSLRRCARASRYPPTEDLSTHAARGRNVPLSSASRSKVSCALATSAERYVRSSPRTPRSRIPPPAASIRAHTIGGHHATSTPPPNSACSRSS